eukprot:g504.t1
MSDAHSDVVSRASMSSIHDESEYEDDMHAEFEVLRAIYHNTGGCGRWNDDDKRWPTNLETLILSSCSIEGSLHAMRFPWKLRHLDVSETPIHVDLVKASPVLPDSIRKLVLQDMHDCTGILPATVLRLCQSAGEGGHGVTFDLSRNTFEMELDMNPSVLAGVKAIRVDESRLGQVRLKGSLPSFRECMDIDSIMFTSFVSAGITKFESEFFYSMNVKEVDLTGRTTSEERRICYAH